MAVLNGDVILISANGNQLKGTVQADMEASADMIDITTKDSGGDKEYLSGERDQTFSVEGKWDPSDTNEGATDAYDDWASGNTVTVLFGQLTSGGTQWSFTDRYSAFSLSGPKNDAATFSLTIQRTGATTKQVVT